MALRNIFHEGDPILRKKCREVDKVDDRIRTILDDMIETMRDAGGVGLAAPQIGIMRRMFVAEPEQGEVYCFVNPEISDVEGMQESDEGCLSVRAMWARWKTGKDKDPRARQGRQYAGIRTGGIPGNSDEP